MGVEWSSNPDQIVVIILKQIPICLILNCEREEGGGLKWRVDKKPGEWAEMKQIISMIDTTTAKIGVQSEAMQKVIARTK